MTYMRSRLEDAIDVLLSDIDIHVINARDNLVAGNNININFLAGNIDSLLDAIRDYRDEYDALMEIRDTINSAKNNYKGVKEWKN